MSSVIASGGRKYTAILEQLVASGKCTVACARIDTTTVINGVKKEKVVWNNRKKLPKGKRLKTEVTETGIEFKLVEDTSVNNL